MRPSFLPTVLASTQLALAAQTHAAEPELISMGTLSSTQSDLSSLNYSLESGIAANQLGGVGSALAWAGGNTFLAPPDRGPNAEAWAGGSTLDNTTSFISRFHTLQLNLVATPGGSLPYTLQTSLQATTLLSSPTALNYGPRAATLTGLVNSNTLAAGSTNYFNGRSDNFAAGLSTNPNNARLDPEGLRVSNDSKSVFVSDEYGPYVYQFDRATGQRIRTFSLPDSFAISHLSSTGATEIAGNTASGRITNKGMEDLAISPDGKTLFGFMQSPLAQDGGDGGRYNRIVKIDLTGATEVSGIADLRTQPGAAIVGTGFLDIRAALNAAGIPDSKIPSKLEGIAFGEDVVVAGKTMHALYLSNDNDFLSTAIPNGSTSAISYGNQFYVFAFEGGGLVQQGITAVPEPSSYAMLAAGLGALGISARRRRKA